MIWNIMFKTYDKKGVVVEEGFETSTAHDIDHAMQEANTMLDLDGVERIEILINSLTLKQE